MPIDAFLFGGRRSTVVPLVHEAFDWEHGVFLGSIMGSETTAAAAGAVGKLRRDPFAMLPFCGYHMGDYFGPLARGRAARRRGAAEGLLRQLVPQGPDDGQFLWPGFGENARVLAWVFRRCDDAVEARETPIGRVPDRGGARHRRPGHRGRGPRRAAARSTADAWQEEIAPIREFYGKFGEKLPAELTAQLDALEQRLRGA